MSDTNVKEIRRGDIFYVHPNPSKSGNGCPAIIISGDYVNVHSDSVCVVYINQVAPESLPAITVRVCNGRIRGVASCSNMRTVSKACLGDYATSLPSSQIESLDEALLSALFDGTVSEEDIKTESDSSVSPHGISDEDISRYWEEDSRHTQALLELNLQTTSTELALYKRLYNELLEKVMISGVARSMAGRA